jgi:hypothetical protein
LKAIPSSSFTFKKWDDACKAADDDPKKATITLNKDKTCTAKFIAKG